MSSSKKTYLGLQFGGILSKDEVTPKAWLQTGFAHPHNMDGFNKQWFDFKRTYRDRYAYKRIQKKLGSAVSGTGTRYVIDKVAEEAYIKSISPDFDFVVSSYIGFPTPQELAEEYLFLKFGALWAEKYKVKNPGFGSNPYDMYGGSNGQLILWRPVDTTKFYFTYYNYTTNPVGADVLIEDEPNNHPDISYIVKYALTSTPGIQVKIMPFSNISFATKTTASFVPIIPIQVGGRRAVPGSVQEKEVEKFMEDLGLDLETLYPELDKIEDKGKTKAIDTALIIMGVETRDPYVLPFCGVQKAEKYNEYPTKVLDKEVYVDQGGGGHFTSSPTTMNIPCEVTAKWANKHNMRRNKFAKLFYNMIKYYENGSTEINFSAGGLQTLTTIDYSSTIYRGRFQKRKGGLSNPNDVMMTADCKIIMKQLTIDTYEKIEVNSITQVLSMLGEQFTLNMNGSWRSSADKNNSGGAGELYPQLAIPLHLYDRLDFTTAIIAKEYGMKFLFFSKQVVKTKWWKVILGAVLIFISCFSGCWGVGIAAAGTVTVAGVTMSAAVFAAVMAISITVIGMVVQELISNIDSPWARALAQIVFTVVMAYMGGGMKALTNPNTYLPLAASVTTIVYNTYVEIQMKDLGEKRRSMEAAENLRDRVDSQSGSELSQVNTSAHYSQINQMSAEVMYAQMDSMYDFDQYWAVSQQLETRVNVVSG